MGEIEGCKRMMAVLEMNERSEKGVGKKKKRSVVVMMDCWMCRKGCVSHVEESAIPLPKIARI